MGAQTMFVANGLCVSPTVSVCRPQSLSVAHSLCSSPTVSVRHPQPLSVALQQPVSMAQPEFSLAALEACTRNPSQLPPAISSRKLAYKDKISCYFPKCIRNSPQEKRKKRKHLELVSLVDMRTGQDLN
ncbi:hypothetical protein DL95DRAFT_110120 [Leptodontidium sp. 2 PMI_412]|nr:hypothetical protein DL95DRAFT_110120 [Leptodontidium sp. 2 PMI_412]